MAVRFNDAGPPLRRSKTKMFTKRERPEILELEQLRRSLDQLEQECGSSSPGTATYISLLKMCTSSKALAEGKRLHAHIARTRYGSSTLISNLVLNMYGKCGWVEGAASVFRSISLPDAYSWNMMIAAFAENGHLSEAALTFENMPDKDVYARTAMIFAHSKLGNIDDAREIFNAMPEKDVVAWTAMVTAYAQQGYCVEAYSIYQRMDLEGMKPNAITSIATLDACALMTSLFRGRIVHANLVDCRLLSYVKVGTALVNMYGKCGDLATARVVFFSLRTRNICTWSALVAAYAQNGHFSEALYLFRLLEQEGMVPDGVAYISIIYACSHAGLLGIGLEYFASMRDDYGIEPSYGHYGCMLDLLGRAGKLAEAEELIKLAIPKTGLAVAWRTLLGACRIHGDLKRGTRAAEMLFDLDVEHPSSYLVLIDMYEAAGRLDLAARVKKALKGRNMKREASSSYIEVKGKFHEFHAGWTDHPKNQDIYKEIQKLHLEMRRMGYEPCTEAEEIVSYHSERLAIAFGNISTLPGTP